VGATEIWEIANTTEDAHPTPPALRSSSRIINRQPFDSEAYTADYEAAFAAGFQPGDGPPFPYDTRNADGAIGGNLAFSPYLQDSPTRPADTENGWKDTALIPPGFVTPHHRPVGAAIGCREAEWPRVRTSSRSTRLP